MRRHQIGACICAAVVIFVLSACRSARQTEGTGGDAGDAELHTEWVDKMAGAALKDGTVTAKMNLSLKAGGKSLSVGGNCNLKRDEVIQLSLVIMGMMEVGRLEFTPQYMMMVNRMERQYVKVSYSEVPYLLDAGIDFYSLQALFWGDLFVPGSGSSWNESDFSVSRTDESAVLTTQDNGMLQCRFVVDLLTGLLRNTSVASPTKLVSSRLDWTYLHFAAVEQKSFPDKMRLSVRDGVKSYTADFSLGSLKLNAKKVEPTQEPGGKYKKVAPETILKQLMKL